MKGFKDSTKTCYSTGGYAKGGAKGAAKVTKVMGEFKAGTLHSGSKKGPEVSNPKQAIAIALNQARNAGAKIPMSQSQQEAKMQGSKAGTSANVKPANTPASNYRKGGPVQKTDKAMSMTLEKSPSMTHSEYRTMQKYKAAMDSRPKRMPMVKTQPVDALSSTVNSIAPPTAAPSPMDASAPSPVAAAGLPAMKKGGKVKKYADGGLATSVRPAADENMADNAFVNERAAQLRNMVGKAKGGAVKAAVHKHERAMHPGKPLTKLKKGGMTSC
jgi:hypothetical protein